jgi:glycosyltransferase involved in cell wall biosynthesis
MKVLYIGHYKEQSGWGYVTRNQILALDQAGIQVVPRSLNLGNASAEIPERLKQLEYQDPTSCDICIQHVLPHYMKYYGSFKKNIGIFELETMNIKLTSWISHLNLMDEIWVPCKSMINDLCHSEVTKPIKLIPHAVDINEYKQTYNKLNLPINNSFVFYFIGEYGRRKHINALLKAFHTEFTPEEPVELVLKINKAGMTEQNLNTDINNFCAEIKKGLKLWKDPQQYKNEIVITSYLSREDILSLHTSCDCFVMPSYGEAWCAPVIDALGMGKLVIASGTGAMLDHIDSGRNGFLVKGNIEPVFGHYETFEEFGNARERWFNISIMDLMKTMRRVYQLDQTRKTKIGLEARMSVLQYNYPIIGSLMRETLGV